MSYYYDFPRFETSFVSPNPFKLKTPASQLEWVVTPMGVLRGVMNQVRFLLIRQSGMEEGGVGEGVINGGRDPKISFPPRTKENPFRSF